MIQETATIPSPYKGLTLRLGDTEIKTRPHVSVCFTSFRGVSQMQAAALKRQWLPLRMHMQCVKKSGAMPSPTPPHIIAAALSDVRAGMPRAEAARKHGIHRSIITRALQREASRCPTCGQVVNGKAEK